MSPVPDAKKPYRKPWLSRDDQVTVLKNRGIVIADDAGAAAFLSHVNYYRLSGYCLAFETARHQVVAGTTFEQIREAYQFDCELRDLVTEGLEVVEVDLRTAIAYHFGMAHGPFGHVDPSHFFARRFDHADWLLRLQRESTRSSEVFVRHFRAKYLEFPDLPVWVVTEIMSFGTLSLMFKNMLRENQRAIANRYGLQARTLVAWMHHLVYVRNLCAHHARIWDRTWSIKPLLPYGRNWKPPSLPGNERLFTTLLLLYQMQTRCNGIAPTQTKWRDRILALLQRPPSAPNANALMGLPPYWNSHALWA